MLQWLGAHPKPASEERERDIEREGERERGRERVQRGLDWFGIVLHALKKGLCPNLQSECEQERTGGKEKKWL